MLPANLVRHFGASADCADAVFAAWGLLSLNSLMAGATCERAVRQESTWVKRAVEDLCRNCCIQLELAQQSPNTPVASDTDVVQHSAGRRMKRNVLLVGDPGVGKTAVAAGLDLVWLLSWNATGLGRNGAELRCRQVEALAQRIAAGRAPTWLAGKRPIDRLRLY